MTAGRSPQNHKDRGRSRRPPRVEPGAVPTPASVDTSGPSKSNVMRLARALSVLGYCSRREAERLIAAGHVTVNGERLTDPARSVNIEQDRIVVQGRQAATTRRLRTVALNKPRGVVSTVRDRHAERTVVELVPARERLYPVGRLDKDSEGLILLTNDGDLANLVTHPRYGVEKEYLVLVPEIPAPRALRQLRAGVVLEDGRTAPARVEIYDPRPEGAWLRLVLQEGRNREVRRMLEAVGSSVQRLIRTRIGPIKLGELRAGQFREVREQEVRALRAGASRRAKERTPPQETDVPASLEPEHTMGGSNAGAVDKMLRETRRLIVAIDGPAASGKTTVGTLLAERLGAVFLDTGVLYRALTLVALEKGVALDAESELGGLAEALDVRVLPPGQADGRLCDVMLGDRDITREVRSPEVDRRVSEVAGLAAVRTALIPAQRGAVGDGRAVVVGRDIGTVIFPDADVKVYLDASPAERAARRARERGVDVEVVEAEMGRRDTLDQERAVAPLQRAPDAVVVGTDGVTVSEVVDRLIRLVEEQVSGRA